MTVQNRLNGLAVPRKDPNYEQTRLDLAGVPKGRSRVAGPQRLNWAVVLHNNRNLPSGRTSEPAFCLEGPRLEGQ